MRKIFITLLFLFSFNTTTVFAEQLHTFQSMVQSIKNGQSLKFVIDLRECAESSIFAPIIYTEAHSIMLKDNRVQFANSHLTTNNPEFPQIPVIENCTYRIDYTKASDSAYLTITTRVIRLSNSKVLSQRKITCLWKYLKVFN